MFLYCVDTLVLVACGYEWRVTEAPSVGKFHIAELAGRGGREERATAEAGPKEGCVACAVTIRFARECGQSVSGFATFT